MSIPVLTILNYRNVENEHVQEAAVHFESSGWDVLIRSREARGDFLKDTKSREEENVDCLG